MFIKNISFTKINYEDIQNDGMNAIDWNIHSLIGPSMINCAYFILQFVIYNYILVLIIIPDYWLIFSYCKML